MIYSCLTQELKEKLTKNNKKAECIVNSVKASY